MPDEGPCGSLGALAPEHAQTQMQPVRRDTLEPVCVCQSLRSSGAASQQLPGPMTRRVRWHSDRPRGGVWSCSAG